MTRVWESVSCEKSVLGAFFLARTWRERPAREEAEPTMATKKKLKTNIALPAHPVFGGFVALAR